MELPSFEGTTRAFHQALRTDDAAALFSYVADDVLLMPPGEPAVLGKSAMQECYAGFLAAYRTTSLVLSHPEVFVTDEWAVEVGRYEWGLAPVAGGAAFVDSGSYMQLWRQREDGQWRFTREIWNSSVPV